MNGYPIGIYEKALLRKKPELLLDDAASLGFDTFELSIDESDERLNRLDWDSSTRKKFVSAAADAGILPYSMCFSGHRRFPMGSSDPQVEKHAMELMKKALSLACDLGIRVIQMAGYDVFYEPHTSDTAKRFEDNLQKSVQWAEACGVMLSLETVEKYTTSVEKAMDSVRQIDSPWLSVYPDVANLYMAGLDVCGELCRGRGRIAAVHMREAPDDTYLPFGSGALDFERIFMTLKNVDFHGPLVVELWNESNQEYRDILRHSLRFLKEKMEEQ